MFFIFNLFQVANFAKSIFPGYITMSAGFYLKRMGRAYNFRDNLSISKWEVHIRFYIKFLLDVRIKAQFLFHFWIRYSVFPIFDKIRSDFLFHHVWEDFGVYMFAMKIKWRIQNLDCLAPVGIHSQILLICHFYKGLIFHLLNSVPKI